MEHHRPRRVPAGRFRLLQAAMIAGALASVGAVYLGGRLEGFLALALLCGGWRWTEDRAERHRVRALLDEQLVWELARRPETGADDDQGHMVGTASLRDGATVVNAGTRVGDLPRLPRSDEVWSVTLGDLVVGELRGADLDRGARDRSVPGRSTVAAAGVGPPPGDADARPSGESPR